MADKLVIRNGSVLLADGSIRQVDLRLAGGRVAEIGPGLRARAEVAAAGAHVLPGLMDLHLHGLCRESLEESTLADFARLEAERGCTTFLPTFFAPPAVMVQQLQRHRRESQELQLIPQVPGFRLESPYLAQTGAGVSEDLVPISPEITSQLLAAGGGHVRIWDLSPELPGAPGLIRELSAQGIVCSLAHTQATIEQARAAVAAGARLVTHFYDTFVLPEITDPDPGVYPAGLTDYLLVEDRVTCEIIGDGTHVHPLLVEVTLRCKTPDRVAFVTDSNYGAGLPPGRYSTPKWGDILVDGPNAGVRLPDREMELAGSALAPIDSFRNALRLFGQDLAVASRLCARTPARLLGLNKGELAVGRDADVVVLDANLQVRCTIAAGQVIYQASGIGN